MKLLILFSIIICLNCYKNGIAFKKGKIREQGRPRVVIKNGVSENITRYNYYNYTKSKSDWMPIIIGEEDDSASSIGSKPVIYLYPEEPIDISVHLNPTKNEFTTIYPKFNGENTWNVHAEPNGDIIIKGRKYPYLFWEALLYDNQDLNEFLIFLI